MEINSNDCTPGRLLQTVKLLTLDRLNLQNSTPFYCFSGVTVDSYSCLDPGIPVNGIRYGQDFSIGSTVSFGCDSGYRLSHEEPLVCEKNHWWSHPLPTCDGKHLLYFLENR